MTRDEWDRFEKIKRDPDVRHAMTARCEERMRACPERQMSQQTPDTLEPTLYVTDAEIIRRLGVPSKIGYTNIKALDAEPKSGFPQKVKFWGGRRYWPAVRGWLDRTNGLKQGGAARLATENGDRNPPPRVPYPTELPKRRSLP